MAVTAFANLMTVVLFAPYFWVMEHAMRVVVPARQDGSSLSPAGLVLLGAWIAYAGARGI